MHPGRQRTLRLLRVWRAGWPALRRLVGAGLLGRAASSRPAGPCLRGQQEEAHLPAFHQRFQILQFQDRIAAAKPAQRHHRLTGGQDVGRGSLGVERCQDIGFPLALLQQVAGCLADVRQAAALRQPLQIRPGVRQVGVAAVQQRRSGPDRWRCQQPEKPQGCEE